MSQSHDRSGCSVVKDNVVLNARSASGKQKLNATSFKKGRMKTGGRKAGTPNKTTRTIREAMLIGGEAAGNELGGDGFASYFKWVALDHPTSYMSLLGRLMPRQLEPEQTSLPQEGEREFIYTMEELCEEMKLRGVPFETFAKALMRHSAKSLPEQEHSGTAGPMSSTDDHRVEDDASDDSTGEG